MRRVDVRAMYREEDCWIVCTPRAQLDRDQKGWKKSCPTCHAALKDPLHSIMDSNGVWQHKMAQRCPGRCPSLAQCPQVCYYGRTLNQVADMFKQPYAVDHSEECKAAGKIASREHRDAQRVITQAASAERTREENKCQEENRLSAASRLGGLVELYRSADMKANIPAHVFSDALDTVKQVPVPFTF